MKTPDEIKKGMEDVMNALEEYFLCRHDLTFETYQKGMSAIPNALALIQQLEAERDAAVDALTKIVQKNDESFCEYCDNWDRYTCPSSCRTYCERFKWRGVQKEELTDV